MAEIAANPMHFDDGSASNEQAHEFKNMSPERAMILKLTHPPTTVPELEGLPTNDARTQVVIQWRNNDILKTPSIVTEQGVTEDVDWSTVTDYGFIVPNSARVQYIGCTYGPVGSPVEGQYVQDVKNTKIQDNFDFSVWSKTVNLYRPIYKSTTLYSNVTMFNNVGSINVQQFNPAILFAGKLSEFSFQSPELFARFLKDGVAASRISLGGAVHCDYNLSAVEHYFRSTGQKTSGFDLDPSTTIQVIDLGKVGYEQDVTSLMPTPSQINTNSMRSFAGKFQDGAFAVQRLNTIAPRWLVGSRPSINYNGLYECYTYTVLSDGTGHFVPLAEQTAPGKSKVLLDTLWSQDMTWTFIRCQGLTAQSVTSQDIPPFLIKQYYGMEAQPVWGGPWNGLSRESPRPSLKAMQQLIDAFYAMPDAMEAKYNFLGTILPFLKGLIPAGVSLLSGLFKPKEEKKDRRRDDSSSMASIARQLRELRLERAVVPSAPPAPTVVVPSAPPMPTVSRRGRNAVTTVPAETPVQVTTRRNGRMRVAVTGTVPNAERVRNRRQRRPRNRRTVRW